MADSARHALATIALFASFGAGAGVAAATDGPPATAAAPEAPDAAHAARAKRRWIVEGTSFEASLVDPVRRRMYLFDARAHAPFAVSTESGARLWTAKPPPSAKAPPRPARTPLDALEADPRFLELLPPVERQHLAHRPRLDLATAVLRRTVDTLLVSEAKTLTAYDLESGELLWTRDDPCRLEEARGELARLSCYPLGAVAVINARSGKPVLALRRSYADQVALGPHALLSFSTGAETLSSRSLDRAGASWSVALLPHDQMPRQRSSSGRHVIVMDGATVVAGEALIGVDPRTGRVLWRSPAAGCDTAAALGQDLGLVCADRLELRDPATGRIRDASSLPLPTGDHGRLDLIGDAQHQMIVEVPHAVGATDRIFVRARAANAWTTLRRPSLAVTYGWDGRLIVAAGSYDGFVFGLDPASPEPSLASLPPERAIAAILDDAASWDRFVAQDLMTVDGLGPALARRLEHPDGPLYGEALAYLEQHPFAQALPTLVRRLAQAGTSGERRAILDDISAQDSEDATRALVDWLKDAPSSHDPIWGDRHDPLYRQVWRTGRTAETGLCVGGTRPVPELAAPASDGSIGTAHPLLFQSAAPDGSWVGICQARHDTNHDGVISVLRGHHGETLGDDMQPYLVVGSGTGLPVDDLLGHDPTGRYVAVRQGACLDVIDTKERTATRLPDADLREADPFFGPSRAVSFDADGTRMLYIKGGVPRPGLVVRDLGRGTETTLNPGPGNLWHATLDPQGSWVMTDSLAGNSWPAITTDAAPRICRAEATSYSVFGVGDRALAPSTHRAIPVAGGPAQEVPGLVRPFGLDLLVRDPDGALGVVSAGGQRLRTLVPADCHARVAHVDGKRGAVVATCQRQDRASLELFDPSGVTVLRPDRLTEAGPLGDSWDVGSPRFARLADGTVVDLDRRALVSKPALAPQEARVPEYRERRTGVYLIRGDGSELALPGRRAFAMGEVPKGPLRWRRPLPAAAIATDNEQPPSPPPVPQLPVRKPLWGLMLGFGGGGGGDDLAKVTYSDGSSATLSAGDGIDISLGLMVTPLWWGDRLGVGVGGTIGYKGISVGGSNGQVSISRFPLTLGIHVLPRIAKQWLLLARIGIDKEVGASFSGSGVAAGNTVDLDAKLGAFAEGGIYEIFDFFNARTQRGAVSLTLRYTKLTYTTVGQSIDGQSFMVLGAFYFNP